MLSTLSAFNSSQPTFFSPTTPDTHDSPGPPPPKKTSLALVAAFLVSPYGCAERAWKPFNPVLGETFELEGDLVAGGGRYLAEQVGGVVGVFYDVVVVSV